MKVIIGPRQSGKSTMLLSMAFDNGWVFVCKNQAMTKHLKSLARDSGLELPEIITRHEFKTRSFHRGRSHGFAIDDAEGWPLEDMLKYSLGNPIEAISLSVPKYDVDIVQVGIKK